MGSAKCSVYSVCAAAACCCNVTEAAVHLDQLAVAGAILQPDKLLLGTLCTLCAAVSAG